MGALAQMKMQPSVCVTTFVLIAVASTSAAPLNPSEVIPEAEELIQGLPGMAGLEGKIMETVACKMRASVKFAQKTKAGAKVIESIVNSPQWKKHGKELNALLNCVKGTSPIETCVKEATKQPALMGYLMQVAPAMQTKLADLEKAIPHFEKKVASEKC